MNPYDVVMAGPNDFSTARASNGSTGSPNRFGSRSTSTGTRIRLGDCPPIVDAATIAKLTSSPVVSSPLADRRACRPARSSYSSSAPSSPILSLGSPGGKQTRSPLYRQVFRRYENQSPYARYKGLRRSGMYEPGSTTDGGINQSSSMSRPRDNMEIIPTMADWQSNSPEFNGYLVRTLEEDLEKARRKYQMYREKEDKSSRELDDYLKSPSPKTPEFLEYLVDKEQAVLASKSAHSELRILARRLKRARIGQAESTTDTGGSPPEIRSPHPSLPKGTISVEYVKESYLNLMNSLENQGRFQSRYSQPSIERPGVQ